MTNRKNVEITVPGFDGVLIVDYGYYAGCPAKLYLRNGDPGYPAEPPEVEITKVLVKPNGDDISELLSADAIDKMCEAISEREMERGDY